MSPFKKNVKSIIFFLSTHKWPEFEIIQNLIGGGGGRSFTKILLLLENPSETYRRLIGDWHAWSETSTCFIRDRHTWLETHRRPGNASSETDMLHWRHIKDRHACTENHRRPTCLIRDPLETHQRPQYASLEFDSYVGLRWVSNKECRFQMGFPWGMLVSDGSPTGHAIFRWVTNWSMLRSPFRHVSLRWGMSVTNGVCRSLVGLRSGMLVFDEACRGLRSGISLRWCMSRSPIRHLRLRWVSDRSPMDLR